MSTEAQTNPRLHGRRCLVTGATGYLGRRLVPRLIAAGMRVTAQVRALDASKGLDGVDILAGDMTAPEWPESMRREWRWDDVVHLAGSVGAGGGGFVEEARAARVHVRLALAMQRALPATWSGRVVHASSMTVYGAAPTLPVNEHQALAPRFPYAFAKALAEDVWNASELRDCWLLRFPGLFSASRPSGALFHFTRAALEGQPIKIAAKEPTLWDVLHVDDAAEAITRVLGCASPFKGPMNVSYGEVVELERVARRLAELTTGVGVINELRIEHPPFQLDIGLLRARIAWPPCGLDSRLRELVAELRQDARS